MVLFLGIVALNEQRNFMVLYNKKEFFLEVITIEI